MSAAATLLLPCVGKSSRYPGVPPKWMLTTPDGRLALQRAMASVYGAERMRRIVAVRRDHDQAHGAVQVVRHALGDDVEILVIDHDTNGPAETVALMLQMAQVGGSFQVKDADSFFTPHAPPGRAFVTTVDLRHNLDLSRIGAKSFVTLDPQGRITAMVEKSVASNHISVGLYAFGDAAQYLGWLDEVRAAAPAGELFLSMVIAHALTKGAEFHANPVSGLVDVGTLTDWVQYVAQQQVYLVELDGIVFHQQHAHTSPRWNEALVPIAANIAHLLRLQHQGGQMVFLTARPEDWRDALTAALTAQGLRPHALVMGLAHSSRMLVGRFSTAQPYPQAQAVNVDSDSSDLPRYLP